jgi:hypothetical protein
MSCCAVQPTGLEIPLGHTQAWHAVADWMLRLSR